MSECDAQLLRVVTDRLSRRFPWESGVLVQASVRVAYARLSDARVRDFLPVLVERAAADSLRRLAA
ncbi:MAG: hypothetical protein M3Q47_07540 [Actinomycetota bacterium]|nr:hypothetical protein [Actinomycetota bacterium]